MSEDSVTEQKQPLWQLSVGYDYRFGCIGLSLQQHDGDEPLRFYLPLAKLFRECNIHPEELRAYMADAQAPEPMPNGKDIETIRAEAITNCDLKGKTVLDIGGYDGWAARLALDCGAARAIWLDNQQYQHYGWAEKRLPGVEYIEGDFIDWHEPVDVVIFYNVIYHIRNVWAALDHLRTITKERMLLCTLFRYSDRPQWYLYEERECNKSDETVYWGPSISGLERLLKATGWDYRQVGLALDRVVYDCTPTPGFVRTHQDT